jgi:beta-glucosidase
LFSSDFVWGVATSSYQIEGAAKVDGRGPSIWDTFSALPGKVANGHTGEVANNHYHRYPEDVRIMKEIGVKAYRFSISWSRLFPNGDDKREDRGFAFYHRLLDELETAGIEPYCTLYHWDLPQALQDKGGWANREIVEAFRFYAEAVAKEFGHRIKYFATINEPWVVAWLGYSMGVHAPGIQDNRQAIAASHHTVMAHNAAVKAIKSIHPTAKVGPVLNQTMPDVDDLFDPEQIKAAHYLDANTNTFWMSGIFKAEYPEIIWEMYGEDLKQVVQPGDLEVVENDWLGINYYFNNRIGHKVPKDHFSRARVIDDFLGYAVESQSVGPMTDMGWPITPYGIADLMVRWTREYGPAVPQMFITENGCAFSTSPDENGEINDFERIAYLNDHIAEVENAINRGANVGGYFQWSLMDNFEWAMGYDLRFGIVYVDFETQIRTLKKSAHFYKEVISTNGGNLKRRSSQIA